jgi:ribosomal protein S2
VAIVQVQELIAAGVHFGHRASRWNPKMRPYIYGKRNLIHIIDLRETVRGLLRAKKYLAQVAAQGSLVLFVGTKRQAKEAIEREAGRCGMPYVSERWLGGTLTNYDTIRNRLNRLKEIEQWEADGRGGCVALAVDGVGLRDGCGELGDGSAFDRDGRLPCGHADDLVPVQVRPHVCPPGALD